LQRAFAEFEAIANLHFIEVTDAHDRVGDIRIYWAEEAFNQVFSAHIALNTDASYSTFVHEIGHVLRLKHPFDSKLGFPHNPEHAGSERSIMS
jgi:hypothetical protein